MSEKEQKEPSQKVYFLFSQRTDRSDCLPYVNVFPVSVTARIPRQDLGLLSKY